MLLCAGMMASAIERRLSFTKMTFRARVDLNQTKRRARNWKSTSSASYRLRLNQLNMKTPLNSLLRSDQGPAEPQSRDREDHAADDSDRQELRPYDVDTG